MTAPGPLAARRLSPLHGGRELRVKVADWAVGGADDVLVTIGLGSCVAIALHDRRARVGGLAHILLPTPAMSRDTTNRGKYPCTAVPLVVDAMRALGATGPLVAKLAGGASMFAQLLPAGGVNMGERNVAATVAALAEARIPIVAQETGGDHGRSVYFHPADGHVLVRSLQKGERTL